MRGCVILIDIDDYMRHVSFKTALEERSFLQPFQSDVSRLASENELVLLRTVGDAFLLHKPEVAGASVASNVSKFLIELRDTLVSANLTFKGAVVFGDYITGPIDELNPTSEVCLYGPAGNMAGKLASIVDSSTIGVTWTPMDDAEQTFESATKTMRTASLGLENIEQLPKFVNGESTAASSVSSRKTEGLREIHISFNNSAKSFILETIKLADDKAKAVFALSTALLVYLFNGSSWIQPEAFPNFRTSDWTLAIILAIGVLLLLASAIAAMFVLIPRAKTNLSNGIYFYGSIANHDSAKNYAEIVAGKSASEIEYELSTHNFEISKVTNAKFTFLRRSLYLVAFGVLFTIVFLAVEWIGAEWILSAIASKI